MIIADTLEMGDAQHFQPRATKYGIEITACVPAWNCHLNQVQKQASKWICYIFGAFSYVAGQITTHLRPDVASRLDVVPCTRMHSSTVTEVTQADIPFDLMRMIIVLYNTQW